MLNINNEMYYMNSCMNNLCEELFANAIDFNTVEINTVEVKNEIEDLEIVILNNNDNVEVYTIVISDNKFIYNRKVIGLDKTIETIKDMIGA